MSHIGAPKYSEKFSKSRLYYKLILNKLLINKTTMIILSKVKIESIQRVFTRFGKKRKRRRY